MRLSIALLRLIVPRLPATMGGGAYAGKGKMRILMPGIEAETKDRVVLDFGWPSAEVKEMALLGAKRSTPVRPETSMTQFLSFPFTDLPPPPWIRSAAGCIAYVCLLCKVK